MLKGKQKKLDKNNNGRIDGEDFKLLRADKPMKAALGKSVRGYGAARTSGSGLMDEQMAPGKVINARLGKDANYAKYLKGLKKASDEVKGSKRKKYSSMEEMRKAKGFKPGETPESFNKRRLKLAGAKKALGATRLGKIALGIGAAGIAAKEYLKRKKEKAEMKKEGSMKSPFIPKKMGGGMMNKPMGYKTGGGYDAGNPGKIRDMFTDPKFRLNRRGLSEMEKGSARKFLKKERRKEKLKSILKMGTPATAAVRLVKRSLDILKGSKSPKSGMGGAGRRGSINRTPPKKIEVMEARTGQMVMARGCKLGRKKATKIT
jgi:hypothetical protein